MDLLRYYFRKSDKNDLKGIIEDCEEQFRLGAKEGKSEEKICCKLGHPKNIYRYYIGEPIVPKTTRACPATNTAATAISVPAWRTAFSTTRIAATTTTGSSSWPSSSDATTGNRSCASAMPQKPLKPERISTGTTQQPDGPSGQSRRQPLHGHPRHLIRHPQRLPLPGPGHRHPGSRRHFLHPGLCLYGPPAPADPVPGDPGPGRPDGPLRRNDGQLGQPGLPRRSPRKGGRIK